MYSLRNYDGPKGQNSILDIPVYGDGDGDGDGDGKTMPYSTFIKCSCDGRLIISRNCSLHN